ncbi:MAG: hypothetical protein KGI69_01305 [Patescibacteria group bacterium]|nr:hypothetical protein [Patescibacteria group bacterium]
MRHRKDMKEDLIAEDIIRRVMVRIARKRVQRARALATLHIALIAGALSAFVPAIRYLAERASASGFGEYVSLMFSDGGSLSSTWKVLALSIAESAPVASSAAVIALALVIAYSVRGAARDWSSLRLSSGAASA